MSLVFHCYLISLFWLHLLYFSFHWFLHSVYCNICSSMWVGELDFFLLGGGPVILFYFSLCALNILLHIIFNCVVVLFYVLGTFKACKLLIEVLMPILFWYSHTSVWERVRACVCVHFQTTHCVSDILRQTRLN